MKKCRWVMSREELIIRNSEINWGREISGLYIGKEWKDMESGEVSDKVDLKNFDIKIFKNLQ